MGLLEDLQEEALADLSVSERRSGRVGATLVPQCDVPHDSAPLPSTQAGAKMLYDTDGAPEGGYTRVWCTRRGLNIG